MDRLQSRVHAAAFLRIGVGADADDVTVRREQSAARASLHRHAGALDRVRAFVTVQHGDPQPLNNRQLAAAAADAQHVLAAGDFVLDAGHGRGRHGGRRSQRHQSDVGIEIELHDLAGERW